jgi:Terminase large subunit, T4likevirus-type, N-terminal
MTGILTPDERAEFQKAIRDADAIEHAQWLAPVDFYSPHARGQLQFHKATQIVRALWPGNGFGKTRAMGSEVAWWVYHCHPFQKTPSWPVIGIWAAETYKQFEILKEQLTAECFGPERSAKNPRGWKWNKSKNFFEWAGGDKLYLVSGDASWTAIQGINPDFFAFDEEPPKALYNEAKMRRRGKRKTRYMFAATATQGMTWMYHELYLAWLKHHQELGLNEQQAIEQQLLPWMWAWPTGGIKDNPGTVDDVAYYEAQSFASEAERAVRLFGGFADFSGTPVFDIAALERQRAGLSDGVDGWLTLDTTAAPDLKGRIYKFEPGLEDPEGRGRITIFEMPDTTTHRYVIGHDSAYGLEKGDFDYAVVLDRNTGRQVAEAAGRWGDQRWAEVLHALHYFYGRPRAQGAFMCGERQVGLIVMRRLMDEMGVGYQFYDRDEAKRSRRRSDTLGHFRRAGDLSIPRLRRQIGPKNLKGELLDAEITIVSRELHRQCSKYQYRPRSKTIDVEDAHDSQLITSAPKGDHDDGVLALAYAAMALREVERFEEDDPGYAEGTYGHQFKIHETLTAAARAAEEPAPADPFARD